MAAQLVNFQLYDLHLRALNANSDASAVAWLTPAGIALGLAGTVDYLRRRSSGRARRAVVAAVLVGLLLVASARRGAFGPPLSLHGSTLMLAPARALLLALLLVESREADVTARRLLRIGCALLVDSYVLHLSWVERWPTPSAASTRVRTRLARPSTRARRSRAG